MNRHSSLTQEKLAFELRHDVVYASAIINRKRIIKNSLVLLRLFYYI